MTDRELIVPGYLAITGEAVRRLQSGEWSTNEVVVAGMAELETFVRTPSDDDPLINAGPLEAVPITKGVVNAFEHLAEATNGQVPYGLAAIQRVGILITAVRALEMKTQELERRLAELENNGRG